MKCRSPCLRLRFHLEVILWLSCQFGYKSLAMCTFQLFNKLLNQYFILVMFYSAINILFFLNQFILVVLAQNFCPVTQMVICICKDSSSSSSQTNNRGTLILAANDVPEEANEQDDDALEYISDQDNDIPEYTYRIEQNRIGIFLK